jgi:hypothetical protein
MTWTPRNGSESHWDNIDDCFIEKDHPGKFSLYDAECKLLACASTLDQAKSIHDRMPGHGDDRQPKKGRR